MPVPRAPFPFLVAALAACGGGTTESMPDASASPGYELLVLDPPGEQIGLPFGQMATLRVRYQDSMGEPIPGAPVSFEIAANPANPNEGARGASLSAQQAITDEDGVGWIDLSAGAERTNFRILASAPFVAPVTFYVTVADEGFASLLITPRHEGIRPLSQFEAVELRLFRDQSCAVLDPADPPSSVFPPRTMEEFGVTVGFDALGAGEPHALLAWGEDADSHVLAVGCVELQPGQVRAGVTLSLELAVADLTATLTPEYALTSEVDLAPLAAALLGEDSAWRVARCPLGAAQLVIDAALAPLSSDDPLAQAFGAGRGVPVDGCRAGFTAGGGMSIDAAVMAVLVAEPGAPGAQLSEAAGGLAALLTTLGMESTLRPAAGLATHALGLAWLVDPEGNLYLQDLPATSRPVVTAAGVPTVASDVAISIGAHGFTLRLGWLLRDAFVDTVATPAGLPTDLSVLGDAVVGAASMGTLAGCNAVSAAACGVVDLAEDCLVSRCTDGVTTLSAALEFPFARLDAEGTDFTLQGLATARDSDHDLAIEELAEGLWSVDFALDDATIVSTSGSFASVP